MIVYKSKVLSLAIIMGIGILVFVVTGLFATKNPNPMSMMRGILIFSAPIILVVFVVSLTRIKVSHDGLLHYSEAGFIKKKARVGDITKIDRGSTYRGLAVFGYSMFIYHEQDGEEKAITIGENQFDRKTIKSFVNDLVRINPNIKLHEHYLKLVGRR